MSSNVNSTKLRALDRGSSAPWVKEFAKDKNLIVGVGNTGSWLALCLSKMGIETNIADYDKVEIHNTSTQLYGLYQVNTQKVYAARDIVEALGVEPATVFHADGAILVGQRDYTIVFSMVDTMQSRKSIYEAAKKNACQLLIDPRTYPKGSMIYAVNLGDEKQCAEYEKTLFEDSEASEDTCGLKSTTFTGMTVASIIGGIVANYYTNKAEGFTVMPVPFLTHIDFQMMEMTTTYTDA